MALTDQIIGVESGGDPNARNPNSSAMGAGQFISSTWLDMVGRYRPDLVQGKSPEEILALRSDPQLSREMTEAYAAQNGRTLTQAGHEATPGNTYLAHFAGPKGAVSVLSADPNTPVSAILTPEAIKANPFLARMTAADLRAWADKKMGGAAPVQQPPQASPAAPANGLLAQPSGGLAPPSAGGLLQAPIFPQAAPQQQHHKPSPNRPSKACSTKCSPRRLRRSCSRNSGRSICRNSARRCNGRPSFRNEDKEWLCPSITGAVRLPATLRLIAP
jgi:hypothetical protein